MEVLSQWSRQLKMLKLVLFTLQGEHADYLATMIRNVEEQQKLEI